jgi:hypothetical protein
VNDADRRKYFNEKASPSLRALMVAAHLTLGFDDDHQTLELGSEAVMAALAAVANGAMWVGAVLGANEVRAIFIENGIDVGSRGFDE